MGAEGLRGVPAGTEIEELGTSGLARHLDEVGHRISKTDRRVILVAAGLALRFGFFAAAPAPCVVVPDCLLACGFRRSTFLSAASLLSLVRLPLSRWSVRFCAFVTLSALCPLVPAPGIPSGTLFRLLLFFRQGGEVAVEPLDFLADQL